MTDRGNRARLIGGVILGSVGLLLGAIAAGVGAVAGLSGELRTPVATIDARGCEVLVLDVESITVSPPAGVIGAILARIPYRPAVLLETDARLIRVTEPARDLIGVDHCRARSASGRWDVTTVTAAGRAVPDGELVESRGAGGRLRPSDIDQGLVFLGSPVGSVGVVGVLEVGETASVIFALGAAGVAALVGGIVLMARGPRQGRHEAGVQ